jgi:23S rRNA-/tRNA-specific pseudouridylate synthase
MWATRRLWQATSHQSSASTIGQFRLPDTYSETMKLQEVLYRRREVPLRSAPPNDVCPTRVEVVFWNAVNIRAAATSLKSVAAPPVKHAAPSTMRSRSHGLFVVDKPAGICIDDAQPMELGSAEAENAPSVTSEHKVRPNLMQLAYQALADPNLLPHDHSDLALAPKLRPVHQLDLATSGLMCYALDADTARLMSAQFAARRIRKTYLAIVHGYIDTQKQWADNQGLMDWMMGPTLPGCFHERMVNDPTQPARSMVTRGQVLSHGYLDATKTIPVSLVQLRPTSGRRHQLRLHMAWEGHPIVGDLTYGHSDTRDVDQSVSRMMLHAWKLRIPTTIENGGSDELALQTSHNPFESLILHAESNVQSNVVVPPLAHFHHAGLILLTREADADSSGFGILLRRTPRAQDPCLLEQERHAARGSHYSFPSVPRSPEDSDIFDTAARSLLTVAPGVCGSAHPSFFSARNARELRRRAWDERSVYDTERGVVWCIEISSLPLEELGASDLICVPIEALLQLSSRLPPLSSSSSPAAAAATASIDVNGRSLSISPAVVQWLTDPRYGAATMLRELEVSRSDPELQQNETSTGNS